MDASAGSSPRHSHENPPKHGGGRGEGPAGEIGGGEAAAAADDFMFADDTFPSLPDFPCLSSPSSSTYSSSSSSNSSSAYTANNNAAGGGPGGGGADGAAGEISEPASAGEGFDALEDIDQILDFASLSVPWDSEPLFPDMGMMIEDAMSAPTHPESGNVPDQGQAVLEGTGTEEAACMDSSAAADDLPRFFMEWLTNNRESISAEDLRGIRLRRSTIEAAAARLGGGRQGTMQLLKLILTWVQNHHLQKKRPRGGAMEETTASQHGGHGQQLSSSPGGGVNNSGYDFPAGGGQDMAGAAAGTSWAAPYQHQPFTPPPAYAGESTVYPTSGGAGQQQYTFHQQQSSVVVNSQPPFSPPAAVGDMHAAGGGNISCWAQQYVPQFPAGASPGSSYPPMPPRVVTQQFSAAGFAAGQYPAMGSTQRMAAGGGGEPSATKEARKKRMARQRRLSCLQQQRSQQLGLGLGQIQGGAVLQQELPSPQAQLAAHSAPVTPAAVGGWFWPSSGQQIRNPLSKTNSSAPMLQVLPSSPPPAKRASSERQDVEIPQRADKRQSVSKADKNLRFLLQKVLKQSDVGSLGRIVLPKKEAEIHLPELKTRDGISIPMEDIGTSRVWNMRYRFWPNNKSRMYLLENTGDFVRSNELQEGDFIVIYSDVKSGKYLIRGVKVRPAHEQGHGSSGILGKHKHGGCPERAGASGSEDGSVLDGKPDGACKSRSPHVGVRRARQEAAAMGQMALSI